MSVCIYIHTHTLFQAGKANRLQSLSRDAVSALQCLHCSAFRLLAWWDTLELSLLSLDREVKMLQKPKMKLGGKLARKMVIKKASVLCCSSLVVKNINKMQVFTVMICALYAVFVPWPSTF